MLQEEEVVELGTSVSAERETARDESKEDKLEALAHLLARTVCLLVAAQEEEEAAASAAEVSQKRLMVSSDVVHSFIAVPLVAVLCVAQVAEAAVRCFWTVRWLPPPEVVTVEQRLAQPGLASGALVEMALPEGSEVLLEPRPVCIKLSHRAVMEAQLLEAMVVQGRQSRAIPTARQTRGPL
jgi:hypothetical protein